MAHSKRGAATGGGKFGKNHGGADGITTKLLHSPMSKKMTPKGGGKALSGKTKGY